MDKKHLEYVNELLQVQENINYLWNYFIREQLSKFISLSWSQVLECHLVTDPRSRESRGFGFVTMETTEDAERCIKYLNRSVLEGRLITVEKVSGCTKGPSLLFSETELFTYNFL